MPVLAWLLAPGLPLHEGVAAGVDLGAASLAQLDEMIEASRRAGRPGPPAPQDRHRAVPGRRDVADWPALLDAAAKAQADGVVEVVGVWSHFVYADVPGHPTTDRQLAVFHEGLAMVERAGLRPRWRHLANSAATLTRPDTHFDLVRPGLAVYGLSPVRRRDVRAAAGDDRPRPGDAHQAGARRHRRLLRARLPHATADANLAVVPLGYADGVPRHASNTGPVQLGGGRRTIAGRVCMDQFVVDCGDDPVADGDVATLFGRGDDGEPTADDWAEAVGTINYEIVTRIGSRGCPGSTTASDHECIAFRVRGPPAGRVAGDRRRGGRGGRGRSGGRRRRPSGPWSAGSRPTRPTATRTRRSASSGTTRRSGWSCRTAPTSTSRWSSRPGRCRAPDGGAGARLLPGHGDVPLPAPDARRPR